LDKKRRCEFPPRVLIADVYLFVVNAYFGQLFDELSAGHGCVM